MVTFVVLLVTAGIRATPGVLCVLAGLSFLTIGRRTFAPAPAAALATA